MFGGLFQRFGINAHPVTFQIGKYAYERHFYFIEEMFNPLFLQFFFKYIL